MNFRFLYSTIMLLLLASPVFSSTISYVYDDLDRLHEVTLENGQKITYEYDQIGNMISKMPSGNVVTITANATAGGSIYPNGSITTTLGGRKQYSIAPSAGYVIESLYVDGVSQGAINSYTFNNITASHTITANFALNHYTITATAGSGGTISPSGPVAVNYNSNQGFTMTPATGYHIADVVVDGHSLGPLPNYGFLNVASNHSISASFAINQYPVTFTAGPNGSLTGSTSQSVNYGSSTTAVTAVPAAGYNFGYWSGVDPAASYSNPLIVSNVTQSHNITANFTAPAPVTPPDLEMNPGYMLMVPERLFIGQQYYIDATAINLGTVAAGPYYANVYLSTDSTITTSDIFLGQVVPGGSSIIPITIPAVIAKGQYYIGAIADATNIVAESDETNNTYVYNNGNPVTIDNAGDLAVTSFISPAHANLNHQFPVQVTIKNQGSYDFTGIDVEVRVSTDNTVSMDDYTTDYFLKDVYIDSLPVGESITLENIMVSVDSAHPWPYIGVLTYSWSNMVEADNTNNTKVNAIMFHNDLTPPTSTTSPAGGVFSTSQIVTLTCNDGTGSGCDKIYYTTDGSVPTTSSLVYSAPLSVPASTTNTTIKYFAMDNVGNSEAVKSQVYTIIDTTPPSGTVTINSGAATTNSAAVTLTPTCSDANGCSQMQFSNDNNTWSTAEAYAAGKAWTLASGDGTKTVYAKFKDVAGNWSVVVNDTILLDTAAPTTTALPVGGTYPAAQSVTLTCGDGTGTGCDKIYYTTDGTIPTAASGVYTTPLTLAATTTIKYFATDLVGNKSVVTTQTYTVSYTITAIAGSNGTISPSSSMVNYGGSKTFNISHTSRYQTADVKVDGVSQGPLSSYTFSNVTATHTIEAIFTLLPCSNPPARIAGTTPVYFSTLQAAYNAAASGATIQTQGQRFTENFVANRDISVTIDGGYTCEYATTPSDKTMLQGEQHITGGVVKFMNFNIIK